MKAAICYYAHPLHRYIILLPFQFQCWSFLFTETQILFLLPPQRLSRTRWRGAMGGTPQPWCMVSSQHRRIPSQAQPSAPSLSRTSWTPLKDLSRDNHQYMPIGYLCNPLRYGKFISFSNSVNSSPCKTLIIFYSCILHSVHGLSS